MYIAMEVYDADGQRSYSGDAEYNLFMTRTQALAWCEQRRQEERARAKAEGFEYDGDFDIYGPFNPDN